MVCWSRLIPRLFGWLLTGGFFFCVCVVSLFKVDRICTGREVTGNDIKVSAEPHVGEVRQKKTQTKDLFTLSCIPGTCNSTADMEQHIGSTAVPLPWIWYGRRQNSLLGRGRTLRSRVCEFGDCIPAWGRGSPLSPGQHKHTRDHSCPIICKVSNAFLPASSPR